MTTREHIRERIRPYNDRGVKKLVTEYEYLLRGDVHKAHMWLDGLEPVLTRIRAMDEEFDQRLSAILHEPLPPLKRKPVVCQWIETTRREMPHHPFNLDMSNISIKQRAKLRPQLPYERT